MQLGLPTLPLLAVTLSLGAMGGVTAARLGAPAPRPGAALPTDPTAQAAIVDEDPAARGTDARSVVRAADGMFYVRARVNGRPVRFLVDTGASVTVLTPADAARVGAAPHHPGFGARMDTAGGRARMAWTRLASVRVAGREARGVRAALVRGNLGVSLLGQNMLAQLGAVRIEGDRLILG